MGAEETRFKDMAKHPLLLAYDASKKKGGLSAALRGCPGQARA